MGEFEQELELSDKTNIRVVGVGGAGGNAVNRMIAEGLQNVEFVAINTDARDLMRSDADTKISLSDASSRGLGAGADPEKGAKAAQDHQSDIEEALKGSDMVFVTCGEGGGTGTGASPIVARAARQQGALTIGVVTRPFSFEGKQRAAAANIGIENLRKEVDALLVISNDRLLDMGDSSTLEVFKAADSALLSGVRGITDLISSTSHIHVDFSDVTTILRDSGTALFGIGTARGDDRASKAAEIAINSPLLEESIDGASGLLISIAGSTDIKMKEIETAMKLVQNAVDPEAQIIMGLALDDAYGDDVRIIVIAAGFKPKQVAEQITPARNFVQSQSASSEDSYSNSALSASQTSNQISAQSVPQLSTQSTNAGTSQSVDQDMSGSSAYSQGNSAEPAIVSGNDLGDLDLPDFLR